MQQQLCAHRALNCVCVWVLNVRNDGVDGNGADDDGDGVNDDGIDGNGSFTHLTIANN